MSTITINNEGILSVEIGGAVESHILASPNATKWEVESNIGSDLLTATDGAGGDASTWVLFDGAGVQWAVTIDDGGVLYVENFEQNIVIAPILHSPVVANGALAVGYQLFIYLAGTQIPATVYTNGEIIGTQSVPIPLNDFGLPANPIYIEVGVAYDVSLVPPGGGQPVKQWSWLVGGVPIDSVTSTEWSGPQAKAAYVSDTQVSVIGDVRGVFSTGRRVRVFQGVYEYGTVTGTVPSGTDTIITIQTDATPLNNQVISIEAALLNPSGGAVPSRRHSFGRTVFSGGVTIPVASGLNLLAAGVVLLHINPPPTGYLLCNGAAVSRTTYSVLFGSVNTTFGAGDGSTTFNLPTIASVGSLNYYIYAQG